MNIGFISTRFAGTDGVSLESAKWAEVLWREKHVSFWYAGKLDRDPGQSFVIPEAFFEHPENCWINERVYDTKVRSAEVTYHIHQLRRYLKRTIARFVKKYKIDMLVAQNCLTIPMHIPLGLALTEYISETGIPTIAHHHDFYWERSRFLVNAVPEYLMMAFPPRLPSIQHVVINSTAQEDLAFRTGIPAVVIPNVLDFDEPAPPIDEYNATFREDIGLRPEDILILQPTRVISRKGIEHAIELVRRLGDSNKYKLVISHGSGDEGLEYERYLRHHAAISGVDMRIVSQKVHDKRGVDPATGMKNYSLWDVYPHANLVTYPSLYEGFGNALLEAMYFKKPLLVNRYSIYIRDIEPRGFRVIEMDGYLTDAVVEETRHVLEDEAFRRKMVETNFELARRYFSKDVLEHHLRHLISNVHR
ncbi:glycosyltransferase family 4 protein [Candidatus Sumerlaeota bacterium]|nr:glycosyltransferase family 4 protein [Candidatus Sumerlaeota bacterium]